MKIILPIKPRILVVLVSLAFLLVLFTQSSGGQYVRQKVFGTSYPLQFDEQNRWSYSEHRESAPQSVNVIEQEAAEGN
jgi:hypothetical protein